MKIVTSKEMAALEAKAYKDGMQEDEFMEEAGEGIAFIISDYIENHGLDPHVLLMCGKGNNAGDAYVAGQRLLEMEYDVTALQMVPIDQTVRLCRENYNKFLEAGGQIWDGSTPLEIFREVGIIVDGLFGTGFRGTVQEPFASIIDFANKSGKPIIAIDIPSGLNGETGAIEGEVVVAAETAFLGLPKVGFFLREGWDCVGKLRYVDFGLPDQYIDKHATKMTLLTSDFLKPLLPKLRRSRHKYQAGYVVGLAGSLEMPGAALLSSTAALHGGAGIVRLMYPAEMRGELTSAPFELIKTSYEPKDTAGILAHMNKATAVFIGPGLGKTKHIDHLLGEIIPRIEVPCVIDADALNFLAAHKVQLPGNTILTPHHGEFARMAGIKSIEEVDNNLLDICQKYAEDHKATLVLKGGPTFIFHPGKPIAVSPMGNPGMATAGSGDVLTGLIAAFLAQGMPPAQAAMMGVFVHGNAGEHAAMDHTSYCMTASDIINYLPEALMFVEI
ncbi:MAG: NAD(P)H-hydrate dehydratase [Parachlamydiales bacterium]|jgi:NAD(P)H-hydrate epimerase